MKYVRSLLILLLIFLFSCIDFGQVGRNESAKTITKRANVFLNSKGEQVIKNITQGRKISRYDDGGYFECKLLLVGIKTRDGSNSLCGQDKVRDFIWEHWAKRRLGYVRITYIGVDTATTSHIFIEPDRKGAWAVFWRIVYASALPGSHGEIIDTAKISSVERVLDKPDKGEWALAFKDAFGTTVRRMPNFLDDRKISLSHF